MVGQKLSSRGMLPAPAVVFTFYFVLLALCVPQQGLETHTTHASCQTPGLPAECSWTCNVYVLMDGDRSGEQEKQMSTSELEHGWWGRVSGQAPS